MTDNRIGAAVDVAMLEMRLVWRGRSTRYLFVIMPAFICASTVGVLLMSVHTDPDDFIFLVSVYNPVTYLFLTLSWNASHADGLFSTPIPPSAHLEGRLLAAFLLAAPVAIIVTVETAILWPQSVLLPSTSMLFATVVAALPAVVFSSRHPRRVDGNAPALSDFSMFGIAHYVGVIAVVAPVWIAAKFLTTGELLVAMLGASVAAAAGYPLLLRWASSALTHQIPIVCEAVRRT